jgi:small GTP-binding protein
MLVKKVCMVGPFAVGKTSLVKRFVESIFSDKYHTTIGVKISKKQIELDQHNVQMMLWDIEGVDVFTELKSSYLRGASGVMLVIDGTRPTTIRQLNELLSLVRSHLHETPIVILANKVDLVNEWSLLEEDANKLRENGLTIIETSAKTGAGVEEAFTALAREMLANCANKTS